MPCAFTQSRCHINLAALQHNFIRSGNQDALMPVIKADAYGHGLVEVAKALDACMARRFALGMVDEAKVLRDLGLGQKLVLLMPPTSSEEWKLAAEIDAIPVVCRFEDLLLAKQYGSSQRPFSVAIKLETGMHRLGFREPDIPDLLELLKSSPQIKPVMAISHLACADMPEKVLATKNQYVRFAAMSQILKEAFPWIERSLLNSAGLLSVPDSPFEVARPGLTLYGGNPFHGTSQEALGRGFQWAMEYSSHVLQVTELHKGESVSYGHRFTAGQDMRLAVVGAGYATGVPRSLSGKLEVLIGGKRARQLGAICMSMFMVDVTGFDCHQGDEVWLIGGEAKEGQSPVTVQEWADMLGTIPYEVLCLLGSVNQRVYHGI